MSALGAPSHPQQAMRQALGSLATFFGDARRHTKSIKILVGQFVEKVDFYIVLGKALSILGHAELIEPVCNLLHRGGRSDDETNLWSRSFYGGEQAVRSIAW